MRMFPRSVSLALANLALLSTSAHAHASAPPPCVVAALSANGNILVVNELTYNDPDESHSRRLASATLRVLDRQVGFNGYFLLNSPDHLWTFNLWSVVSTNSKEAGRFACPYLLVTDDGEYLILLTPDFSQNVLSIYRRRDHPGLPGGGTGPDHGVLIREIPLGDLWEAKQIPQMVRDSTPPWFAGGTFKFSADNRSLIHKTRWGRTVFINLETGAVRVR